MATITNRAIIDHLIAHNGEYHGDPPVVKIVEYESGFGGRVSWGIVYEGENPFRYAASAYVRNPRVIFERR
jgi:hypothetical protein